MKMAGSISGLLIALGVLSCQPIATAPLSNAAPASTARAAIASSTATLSASKVAVTGYFGRVLDLQGNPAAGVLVEGYIVGNNGSSVVSNNGGSVVSNNGASIVSNNGSSYRVLDTANLETRSGPDGTFELHGLDDQPLNIEAAYSDQLKAIHMNVPADASGLTLQLQYTGAIAGTVTAPQAPAVTDLEGTDVYIPGTSYAAKTDSSGHFVISNVPVGSFEVVASRNGLGVARAPDVQVQSKATTPVSNLALTLVAPAITTVEPPNGGPGSQITITGTHFGASEGKPFQLSIGGAIVTNPTRVDDQTLTATVPNGAVDGDVYLTVDGIPSNSVPFAVLKSLQIAPAFSALVMGVTQPYGVVALDTDGISVPSPVVHWSETGAALTIAPKSGLATPLQPGDATLTVSSGSLQQSLAVVVSDGAGVVNTLAGAADLGYQDGIGGAAKFHNANGMTIGPDGALYVADSLNHRIRKVLLNGQVSTLVPTGLINSYGDYLDGTTVTARFDNPTGLAFDSQGNLYVVDAGNRAIRKITPDGQVGTFFRGDDTHYQPEWLNGPVGVALDANENLLVTDEWDDDLVQLAPNASPTFVFGKLPPAVAPSDSPSPAASATAAPVRNLPISPIGVVVDAQGNIDVSVPSQQGNGPFIYRVSPEGRLLAMTGAGIIPPAYTDTIEDLDNYLQSLPQDTAYPFQTPQGIALDAVGNLYVADTGANAIFKVSPDFSTITKVVGGGNGAFYQGGDADGPFEKARLQAPLAIAVDLSGQRIYFTEAGYVREIILKPSP